MSLLANILEKTCILNFAVFLIVVPYNRSYVRLFLIIGCLSWIASNFVRYKKNFHRRLIPGNPVNQPILIFIAVCAFTIIFSINPYHSQKIFFSRFLWYFAVFWIGCGLVKCSGRNVFYIAWAMIISSFIMGLGGGWDFFHGYKWPDRLFTVFGHEAPFFMLPLYLTFFCPFAFALLLFSKRSSLRTAGLVNFIIMLLFLICSQSRTAFISVSVSLAVVGLFKNWKMVLKILLTLVLFFLILSAASTTIRGKIQSIPYPQKWDSRVPLYKSAVSMFWDRPLIGAGLGMYEKMIKTPAYRLADDYPYIHTTRDMYLHAHNLYLEVAAEMGIIGLFSFILIFVVFFRNAFTKFRRIADPDIKAVLIGFSAIVAATLVFANGFSVITIGMNDSLMFWFIMGMAAGLIPLDERIKNGDIRQPC